MSEQESRRQGLLIALIVNNLEIIERVCPAALQAKDARQTFSM
jgi:hypothetical protein